MVNRRSRRRRRRRRGGRTRTRGSLRAAQKSYRRHRRSSKCRGMKRRACKGETGCKMTRSNSSARRYCRKARNSRRRR